MAFNMKRIGKTALIFIAVLLIVWVYLLEVGSRHFYCLDNEHCVTVWGEYVIFEKYYGIAYPKSNYLRTSTDNALTIICANNELDYKYIISNDYNKEIDLQIDSSNKVLLYNDRRTFVSKYYTDNILKKGTRYLLLDLGENLAIVNGEKQ